MIFTPVRHLEAELACCCYDLPLFAAASQLLGRNKRGLDRRSSAGKKTADPIRLRSHGKPGQAGQALGSAPSKNIPKKGPQNRRSLGSARDDKREGNASMKSRLPDRRCFSST